LSLYQIGPGNTTVSSSWVKQLFLFSLSDAITREGGRLVEDSPPKSAFQPESQLGHRAWRRPAARLCPRGRSSQLEHGGGGVNVATMLLIDRTVKLPMVARFSNQAKLETFFVQETYLNVW